MGLIEYTLPGGCTVLVGRSEADNDYLSQRVARPDDWWFHVRGLPGSHVVLRTPDGAEADRETLRRAAAIAAHHSKARNAGVARVSCTRARFVRKPRGAKPGTVEIRGELVLKVRPAFGSTAVNASTTPTSQAVGAASSSPPTEAAGRPLLRARRAKPKNAG